MVTPARSRKHALCPHLFHTSGEADLSEIPGAVLVAGSSYRIPVVI